MLTKSPSSPFNRSRWTEQDARAALAALDRSGKSVGVFAAEQGLDPQRLYMWRRRLAGGERTTFQEVIVRSSPAESTFEVVLASGVVLRVPSSFDSDALARLLDVLARAPWETLTWLDGRPLPALHEKPPPPVSATQRTVPDTPLAPYVSRTRRAPPRHARRKAPPRVPPTTRRPRRDVSHHAPLLPAHVSPASKC